MRLTFALALLAACNGDGGNPTPPENLAPTVQTEADLVVQAGSPFTLSGSASDEDGLVTDLTWTQTGGPAVDLAPNVGEATGTAPDVDEATVLTFELRALDDDGATATGRQSVFVRPTGVPSAPIVDAGPPQIVDEQTLVELTGSAIDDGSIVSTEWVVQNPAGIGLFAPDTLQPSFNAPEVTAPVEVVLTLTATDDEGLSTTAHTIVVVQPVNAAPTVDAGTDSTVTAGASVGLAALSSDTDGTVATTEWTQIAGPPVSLDDPTSTAPGFTAPADATVLVFQVTVTDDEGATATDTVSITVTDGSPTNTPPVVDAGADVTVTEGTDVTLSGTATDADGTISSTTWTQLSGPAVSLDPVLEPSFTAPTVTRTEVLVFRLDAFDDQGGLSSDTVAIRVEPVNASPIADAGVDQAVEAGTDVLLAGSASDPDGSIVSTTWTVLEGTGTLVDADTLTPTYTTPAGGFPVVATLLLTVTDDEGAVSTDEVHIASAPLGPVDTPPSVFAGVGGDVPSGSTVTLTGTSSDDNGVVSTTWTQIRGDALVELLDPTDPTTSFTVPDVLCSEQIVLELAATDTAGNTSTSTVTYTIHGTFDEVVTVPTHFDLAADAGFVATGDVWSWQEVAHGPGAAWDGTNAWMTAVEGSYPHDADASLCLPGVDRQGADDVTLSFRLWTEHFGDDGVWLEVLHPTDGWVHLDDVEPAYDQTSPTNSWGNVGRIPAYTLVTAPLPASLPDPVQVRLRFQSNHFLAADGAIVDELRVDRESSDPDGDGRLGVRDEFLAGTDPFVADTDGDGVDDGTEIDDATDPNDPSDFEADPVITPPWAEDFEGGPGDFVADGGLWEHGVPTANISAAHSGSLAWATRLDGDHGADERAWLYLPDLDLTAATEPTLSFRFWQRVFNGDGLSVQVFDDGTWSELAPLTPAYTNTDPTGRGAFGTEGRDDQHVLALFGLEAFVGQQVRLRLSFATDGILNSTGVVLDDVGVHEEADDPDGDGLIGVRDEWFTYGTDPFVADSDADGQVDGDEVGDGHEPLNPADHAGAPVLTLPVHLDFTADDGGCRSEGEGFAWGPITSGPEAGWDGPNGWATGLAGDTENNHQTALYLPLVDLAGSTAPVLSFRLWAQHGPGDATSIQIFDDGVWTVLSPETLAYDGTSADGLPGWNTVDLREPYELVTVDLSPWAGETVRLRLFSQMDGTLTGRGVYVDEIRIDDGSTDPDGDGILGVLAEARDGLDPYLADTDGDGELDGDELLDNTDPLNPADHLEAPIWAVGSMESLTVDGGGLGTIGSLWAYGVPTQGPLSGYTGGRVWGTDLHAFYAARERAALYLPLIDLTSATDPGLGFRGWFDTRDGITVEIDDPALGWTPVSTVVPAYDRTDALGNAAWQVPTEDQTWDFVGVDLSAFTGQVVALRLVLRSDNTLHDPGLFVDDFMVAEEGIDHDEDGLMGFLDERGNHGTDPLSSDTDGDGVWDGIEVAFGTDPLDDEDFPPQIEEPLPVPLP